jgi:predicted GNAT family N-acyltransferase
MEQDLLAGLDALAHVLLARAAPVRFELASSAAEQREIFALRYATVVAEGWVAPSAYPDGLERDDYDASAMHIAGRQAGELVAAARLVFPKYGTRLPTEQEFELTVEPGGEVVDIGRAIVAKAYRSRDHTLFGALLSRCWLAIRKEGYGNLCGTASAERLARYRQFGLPLKIIGQPRPYWGEDRYPVCLKGNEFAAFANQFTGTEAGVPQP